MNREDRGWNEVLWFWFPEGNSLNVTANAHLDHWAWRMHGGADGEIVARFSDLTARGAEGALDHWAAEPEGRLALIVVLDQFSRSLWRDTACAFMQDPAALALAMEALANGHYQAMRKPWFKIACTQPLGHCEGADHLERLDLLIRLREEIAAEAPAPLQPIYRSLVRQAYDVRRVIEAFGRHPHRNQALRRQATTAEESYLEKGDFPHDRAFRQ